MGDALLAGEITGFIENNTRECRRGGEEIPFDEEVFEEYLRPRCRRGEFSEEDFNEEEEEAEMVHLTDEQCLILDVVNLCVIHDRRWNLPEITREETL